MYCASLSDGGCPCGDGEVRCGSFCADVCCDHDKEEYCVDWDGTANDGASYCRSYDDGGCPCRAGQTRCGADESTIGYCSSICCEGAEPNLCIGEGFQFYCAAECALNDSFDRNKQKMVGVARSYGSPDEQDIIHRLLRLHRGADDGEKRRLEVEAVSLTQTIESRRAHAKKSFQPRDYELSFM